MRFGGEPAPIEETIRIVRTETGTTETGTIAAGEASEIRFSEPYPGEETEWWCDLWFPAAYDDALSAAGEDAAQARELVRWQASELMDHFGFRRVEGKG